MFINDFYQYYETSKLFRKKFNYVHLNRLFSVFAVLLDKNVLNIMDEIATNVYNVSSTVNLENPRLIVFEE